MKRRWTLSPLFPALLCIAALAPGAPAGEPGPKDKQLHGKDLRQDDPVVRHYLDENMPPILTDPLPPNANEIAMLADMVQNGERTEVERVAWVLGDWKGAGNIPILLASCDSKWSSVAAQAATSLGMLAPLIEGEQRGRVVEKLRFLLQDKDRRVALAALQALGALKASEAAADLGKFAALDDYEAAVPALRSLGEIGDARNIAYIQPRLDAPNVHIGQAAIETVGKLGDAGLARLLVPKLHAESPTQRVAAVRAMAALKATAQEPDLVELLGDEHGYIRREALSALADIAGPKYEDRYEAMTRDTDHTVRQTAVHSIGRFRLVNCAGAAFRLFGDEHFYVREEAVDTMCLLDTDEVRRLCASGFTDKTDTVRECSSQTMGRLRCDQNLEAHIALLEDSWVPSRVWAAWALGEIGRTEASPALYKFAFPNDDQSDPNRKEMAAAVKAILEALPVKDRMLWMDARASAVLSMGKLGYAEALSNYRWAVPQKPVPGFDGQPTDLRKAAVRSMGMLKDADGINILIGRLNDMRGMYPESPDLRFEAVVALGRIGSPGTVPTLQQHMEMEEEMYDIRTICLWAIEQITGRRPDYQLPPRQHPTPDYFIRYQQKEEEEPPKADKDKAP